jgi:hypothetical protein
VLRSFWCGLENFSYRNVDPNLQSSSSGVSSSKRHIT